MLAYCLPRTSSADLIIDISGAIEKSANNWSYCTIADKEVCTATIEIETDPKNKKYNVFAKLRPVHMVGFNTELP